MTLRSDHRARIPGPLGSVPEGAGTRGPGPIGLHVWNSPTNWSGVKSLSMI
jgi:hypothetical protein